MLSKLIRKKELDLSNEYTTYIDPRNFHLIPKPRADTGTEAIVIPRKPRRPTSNRKDPIPWLRTWH